MDFVSKEYIHDHHITDIVVTVSHMGFHYPIRKEEFINKYSNVIKSRNMAANHISVYINDNWSTLGEFIELLKKLLAKVNIIIDLTLTAMGSIFRIEFPTPENPIILPLIIYMAKIADLKADPEPDFVLACCAGPIDQLRCQND